MKKMSKCNVQKIFFRWSLDFDTGVGKVNKLVNKKNKLFSFRFSTFVADYFRTI